MLETIQDWLHEGPRNPPGIFKLFSLLLFASLCITVALLQSSYWWLFGALIVVDVLGMLASADSIVSGNRAVFFLAVMVTVIVGNPSNIFVLTLEMLGLIASLDFSFLLRKVDGTGVDRSVFADRLRSYVYTILPAFLLTYLMLYLYSQNLEFNSFDAVIALGLASVGVLAIIYVVVHFLISFNRVDNLQL
ncbi:MAG: hypothetical protein ABSE82_16285 [Nitrososphaerales archaeon]|jgi:hypothetical protein